MPNGPIFKPAPEAQSIAEALIPEHHESLADFHVPVRCLFRCAKSWRKAGRTVWGTAQLVSGLQAYLAQAPNESIADPNEPFFLILVDENAWADMSKANKKALVDHELCHCIVEVDDETGEIKPSIVGHDLEEFNCIVARYGLWKTDVKAFVEEGSKHLVPAKR